jgi:hypothetical protein
VGFRHTEVLRIEQRFSNSVVHVSARHRACCVVLICWRIRTERFITCRSVSSSATALGSKMVAGRSSFVRPSARRKIRPRGTPPCCSADEGVVLRSGFLRQKSNRTQSICPGLIPFRNGETFLELLILQRLRFTTCGRLRLFRRRSSLARLEISSESGQRVRANRIRTQRRVYQRRNKHRTL